MAQIDKNTVEATNQLKNKYVFVHEKENAEKKILFVGNSITLHGVKEDIGWFNSWGMAASSEDNDYVHLVMKGLCDNSVTASYCICQVSSWESKYKTGCSLLENYENARKFDADIIIIRCIENCPWNDFDADTFEYEYKKLIEYLNPNKKAKVILTTSFWKHPGDDVIVKTGKDLDYPCIYLGNLGEDDTMKAIGLFDNSGIANHPGDKGMKTIADLLLEKINKII